MSDLTPRQEQVLQLIREYADNTGYPPTRAEIARILGFKSANAAEEHIKALARKGAIEIIPGASRGIRLPEIHSGGIPIIGRVAAGNPILAQEHIEDYCNVHAARIPDTLFSALREHFSEEQVVELTIRIALCSFFKRFNEALHIDLEDSVALELPVPQSALAVE